MTTQDHLAAGESPAAGTVYRKVARRLIPVLFGCYVLAYLDRVNVGFAKLSMKDELWFSDAVFATGSGIFFIGYLLFEVPGNIILHRVGARIWITRIMISWGIISGLCALSTGPFSFYCLRFLLGVAEAGFFPGILLYLTYWFPHAYRARIVALFMTAVAFAGVFGSPLSGWILRQAEGWQGASAWQWLFILEGIPSVLLGICLPFLLCDRPEKAGWLTDAEKRILQRDLEADEELKRQRGHARHRVADAFRSPGVWICCLVYFSFTIGLYGISFWLPQIIESTVTKDKFEVGLYAAIPWTVAAVGMVAFGIRSDRTGARREYLSVAAWTGMLAFFVSGIPGIPAWLILAALSVATAAVMSIVSGFWALPSSILSGTAAAAGIALINSVGNLGGYISPEVFAWLKAHYSLGAGLMAVGASLGIGGLITRLAWK